LIERYGMGEYSLHVSQFGAGKRDQVVDDMQTKLADDVHVAAEQKIEMFGDGTGEGILDRDHGSVDGFALHPIEDF